MRVQRVDAGVVELAQRRMAVSSPKLVSKALGREVDLEELGGWQMHMETTGLIDQAVDSDEQAMQAIRRYLSYLPSNHREAPPIAEMPAGSGADLADLHTLIPERRTRAYDVTQVLERIVDAGSLFQLKAGYGKPAVTALFAPRWASRRCAAAGSRTSRARACGPCC